MQREFEVFHEALERSPSDRAAFLETIRLSDPEIVQRVERLLASHDRAECSDTEGLAPTGGAAATIDPLPEMIGPYRVLERLGEGGMGVVYSAEQFEPLRRRVAIKVVKLGMDTREVIARFEAERQALALMDHPGVAKVLDAGVTDAGRPFFVMELVKGLSLIEYCATQRLRLRDRLRLFTEVCSAVQHAHQRGIIHRDLKPSNILVAIQEGRAVSKVIDFGVAKATATRLTERTLFTEQGRLIGTPEYMSPEQAEMSGLDVDTRTDVYSLGVILYQLVSGKLPFDSKTLRDGGFSETLRLIRDVDPPRPSSRFLASSNSEPAALTTESTVRARSLRGELDWIVMRAIAKDRTRRYQSAVDFSDDVERYLNDRPVQAGPPSAFYAVRKFVKRHRYATALMALVLLSTVAGITGLSVGLVSARRAEDLATRRADNALAAANFLERVLFQADPEVGGGSLSLLQMMENAGRLVGAELEPYPEVEASVRESIGVAYRRRSMFAEATPHLLRSLEIRRQRLGESSLETASAFIAVADLRFEHEGNVDDSLELLKRAVLCLRSHGLEDSAANGWVQLDVGIVSLAGDKLGVAARALERCRRLLVEDRGAEHPDISRSLRELAVVALRRGEVSEAERLAREAVTVCQGEAADYIGARAKLVLARILLEGDRFDEAAELLEQTGRQFSETVGDQHIRVGELEACTSLLHLRRGDFARAERAALRCIAMRQQILHEDHWAILEAQLLWQRARIGLGAVESAELALREIAEATKRRVGDDHLLSIDVASARVDCAVAAGDESLRKVRSERLAKLREQRDRRLGIKRGS